ncbi:L-fucose/L-arabinose isomerase family protein [Diplocloster hominis]|uniref:L-fucose/L-arabinose isomerase family protein n=1 Tax=Diplocloster hominis TaxID=3079010 RepID=UPI0031BB6EAC
MVERLKQRNARIGVFGVAHPVYWGQFPGLEEQLMKYHEEFKKIVYENGVDVVDFGMIDYSEKAFAAAEEIKGGKIDILFCNMLTYATSSVFAPIIRALDIPIILVALQPRRQLECEEANTRQQLENDNICSVPEFTGVAIRMGKKVQDVIIGVLYDDNEAKTNISEWCEIAKVLHDLKGARFGLMGHVLEAMYDMHADPTAIADAFGVHVPLLEVDDVLAVYETVTEEEIEEKSRLILECFDTPVPVSDPLTMKLTEEDLYHASKTAVTLDKFVEKYNLTGLAYYYNGRPDSNHRQVVSSFIVGNSLLNAEGIPMCGEFDIKTCIAMFIMDRLNIGGSFAEFHPFDFDEDYIMVGHDGPHHIAIADGKPVLRSLKKFHGKPGSGASIEFKIKEGPITMLGITQSYDGKFKFILGEGISKHGPIPPTGNTNTRGFFEPTTKEYIKKWVMAGPTHHYALGVGHHADTIAKIAEVLHIDYEIIKS